MRHLGTDSTTRLVYPGINVHRLVQVTRSIREWEHETVVLFVGSNDLHPRVGEPDIDSFREDYASLLTILLEISCVLPLTLPTRADAPCFLTRSFNTVIKDLCREKRLACIDAFRTLHRGDDLYHHLKADGVHLTAEANTRLSLVVSQKVMNTNQRARLANGVGPLERSHRGLGAPGTTGGTLIIRGTGDIMSNLARIPGRGIRVRQHWMSTVEHAYQYEKCLENSWPPWLASRIVRSNLSWSGLDVKRYITRAKREYRLACTPRWMAKRVRVLHHFVGLKWDVCPEFRGQMLKTWGMDWTHPVGDSFWGSSRKGGGGKEQFVLVLRQVLQDNCGLPPVGVVAFGLRFGELRDCQPLN